MAYVGKFKWDVFVSYARNDDATAFPGELGWVTAFANALERTVSVFLGEDIKLFFDRRTAEAGVGLLKEMTEAAASSATFVVVASPTYPNRTWTKAELQAFQDSGGDPHRLFVAERLPADGDGRPGILGEINHREFWQHLPNSEAPDPFSPTSEDFRRCMVDFAFKLKKRLRELRTVDNPPPPQPPSASPSASAPPSASVAAPPSAPAPAPAPAPASSSPSPLPSPPPPPPVPTSRRAVLVAQCTDDVCGLADDLRSYLGQFEEEVELVQQGNYPQGGADFRRAFAQDLESADIFVQLLGVSGGRTPPDLPEGYTRHQLEAARAAGKTIMQWRHPELSVEAVGNAAYQALLGDSRVIVCGFEKFKSQVLDCARRPPTTPPPPPDPDKVFINAELDDHVTAEFFATLFSAADFTPVFPKFDGTAVENRSHLDRMMAECGVVFVINAVFPPAWFYNQKKLFESIGPTRKAKPRGLAVCTVPPAKHLSPDIIGDEFEEIDCSDGNIARVREYIASLKGREPKPQLVPLQPTM